MSESQAGVYFRLVWFPSPPLSSSLPSHPSCLFWPVFSWEEDSTINDSSPLYLSDLMSPWCMWPASRPSDPTLSRCSMWFLFIPMKRFCCWASQHRMVTCRASKISFCSWIEGRDTCGHCQGPKKPSSGQAILLQKTLTLRRTIICLSEIEWVQKLRAKTCCYVWLQVSLTSQ